MTDPALDQAVGYAQWYMLRGDSEALVNSRLRLSPDHDWLSEEERQLVISTAAGNIRVLRKIWSGNPEIQPELTQAGFLRKPRRRTRPNEAGER